MGVSVQKLLTAIFSRNKYSVTFLSQFKEIEDTKFVLNAQFCAVKKSLYKYLRLNFKSTTKENKFVSFKSLNKVKPNSLLTHPTLLLCNRLFQGNKHVYNKVLKSLSIFFYLSLFLTLFTVV